MTESKNVPECVANWVEGVHGICGRVKCHFAAVEDPTGAYEWLTKCLLPCEDITSIDGFSDDCLIHDEYED